MFDKPTWEEELSKTAQTDKGSAKPESGNVEKGENEKKTQSASATGLRLPGNNNVSQVAQSINLIGEKNGMSTFRVKKVQKAYDFRGMYSDKSGRLKGGIKNGVITVWQKPQHGGVPKAEWSYNVTLQEVEKAITSIGDPLAGIRRLAKSKEAVANEVWIKSNPKLESIRRENYDRSGGNSAIDPDSSMRVIKSLYEMATGRSINHAEEEWRAEAERESDKREERRDKTLQAVSDIANGAEQNASVAKAKKAFNKSSDNREPIDNMHKAVQTYLKGLITAGEAKTKIAEVWNDFKQSFESFDEAAAQPALGKMKDATGFIERHEKAKRADEEKVAVQKKPVNREYDNRRPILSRAL